jgi:hypothetical protein
MNITALVQTCMSVGKSIFNIDDQFSAITEHIVYYKSLSNLGI